MTTHPLMMDFYELTMANSYFEQNRTDEWGVFDYYFRKIPENGGYAIFAGLENFLNYVKTLKFSDKEIQYLRKMKLFNDGFLDYLSSFKFRGEIYSFREGDVIFPNEPIVTIKAPLIDCQLLETYLLLSLNHQSLIATKSARISMQAQNKQVIELGARRAHGIHAATYGARAAYIGGVNATANVEAGYQFNIPIVGTMAHAFVQSFDTEYDAFQAYAMTYPNNTVLLIDTYDTLESGLINAIKIHNDVLAPIGCYLKGVRIDSGDLAYLSRQTRKILDEAGLSKTQIIVSNSLDEYIIKGLISQNACIDVFGVGERLITAKQEPVFGGVYKIVALEKNGHVIPKIKLSENSVKTSTPGFKQVYRFYDEHNKAFADVVTLRDEIINANEPYVLFDPVNPWKKKTVVPFRVKALLNLVWSNGKSITSIDDAIKARSNAQQGLSELWPEVKRLENPHLYYVDLSAELWQLKHDLIAKHTVRN